MASGTGSINSSIASCIHVKPSEYKLEIEAGFDASNCGGSRAGDGMLDVARFAEVFCLGDGWSAFTGTSQSGEMVLLAASRDAS